MALFLSSVVVNVNLCRLPCHVIPVKAPLPDKFDCYVLVCENLEWSNPEWDFLKTPILEAAKVKAACIINHTSIVKLSTAGSAKCLNVVLNSCPSSNEH